MTALGATAAVVDAVGPVLQHMGALHPFETALVLLIAFGPFVVIGLLVRRERSRAIAAEEAAEAGQAHALGVAEEPVGGERG